MELATSRRRRRNVWPAVLVLIDIIVIVVGLSLVFGGKSENVSPLIAMEECKINLGGAAEQTVLVGGSFAEPEVTVENDCGLIRLEKSGEVNTAVAGDYVIYYTATDAMLRKTTSSRVVHVINPRGTIYLTFDDGPGAYTAELLDILAKYGIKATFFVTCGGDDELILREYNEGHTVALHTCSHNYEYVYASVENYFDDLYSVSERVKRITGAAPSLIRFPGGSSNMVSAMYDGGIGIMSILVREVEARGFTYFDWNVSSGDAGGAYNTEAVFENVVYALKDGGDSVVLQHDIKNYSVAAVEDIIRFGLNNGYVFDALKASSFTAHHGVNN